MISRFRWNGTATKVVYLLAFCAIPMLADSPLGEFVMKGADEMTGTWATALSMIGLVYSGGRMFMGDRGNGHVMPVLLGSSIMLTAPRFVQWIGR